MSGILLRRPIGQPPLKPLGKPVRKRVQGEKPQRLHLLFLTLERTGPVPAGKKELHIVYLVAVGVKVMLLRAGVHTIQLQGMGGQARLLQALPEHGDPEEIRGR